LKTNPLLIGITGGIGAGKSVVCRVFHALGVSIYDADSRAKLLMTEDGELKSQITNLFGKDAFGVDGNLNNKFIASQVFHDKTKLTQLNSYVHPAVKKDFGNWVSENSKHKYLIKEAALLIEAGSYAALNKLIVVTAPKDIKINRILARDPHRDQAQVEAIMQKQLPDNQKIAKADYVLVNDGKDMLLPQILRLHQAFLSE